MRNSWRLLIGTTAVVLTAAFGYAQNSWVIPAGGANEKDPNPVTAATVQQGQTLFTQNCVRCHGKDGTGDGPDGDPNNLPADLTDPYRAPLNPDGTLFYKISNGKGSEMPAFKTKMSNDEVWAVVAYIKTLRKAQ
jgi:cbb3-type cytochrome c oxidase subunit III